MSDGSPSSYDPQLCSLSCDELGIEEVPRRIVSSSGFPLFSVVRYRPSWGTVTRCVVNWECPQGSRLVPLLDRIHAVHVFRRIEACSFLTLNSKHLGCLFFPHTSMSSSSSRYSISVKNDVLAKYQWTWWSHHKRMAKHTANRPISPVFELHAPL